MGQVEEDKFNRRVKTYAIDIGSGIFAACCVAPGIKIVDQAVTEKAADGSKSLVRGALNNVKYFVTSPLQFAKHPTFLAVCAVYSGTYVVANCIQSWCEEHSKDPFWPKLAGTTAANMTLGILKDRYFAQVFSGKPPTKFPLASWGLFVLRDTFTIGSGFTFPPLVSKALMEAKICSSESQAQKLAQIGTPIAMQIVLTPIHLLSLDYYNNKTSTPAARFKQVVSIYPESTAIRFCRVLCAYGIAGIANIGLRKELRSKFL